MGAIAEADLLRLWEWGRGLSPARKALGLLAGTRPDVSWDSLQEWTVGRRDRALFEVRRRLFGPRVCCLTACPRCDTSAEVELDLNDVLAGSAEEVPGVTEPSLLAMEGCQVRWRLLTCRDLLALEGTPGMAEARRQLLACCVVEALQDGRPIEPASLPEGVQDTLAEALSTADPQVRCRLDVTCPACQHRWVTTLDIVAFVWAEIEVEARRLLDEVHRLALAYGWHEEEILRLGALRRWCYLELLSK